MPLEGEMSNFSIISLFSVSVINGIHWDFLLNGFHLKNETARMLEDGHIQNWLFFTIVIMVSVAIICARLDHMEQKND